jgi:hypothetical protein
VKVLGVLVELMNQASGMGVFADFLAGSPNAFNAAKDNVTAMLKSML